MASQGAAFSDGYKWRNVECPCTEMIPDLEWQVTTGVASSVDGNGLLTVNAPFAPQAVRVGVTISNIYGVPSNEALVYFGFKQTIPPSPPI